MERLLHSSKFWTAMLDAGVSIALLLTARFVSPGDVEMVQKVILLLQPVFVALIASIAAEDISSNRTMAKE